MINKFKYDQNFSANKIRILQQIPNTSGRIKLFEKDKKKTTSEFFATLSLTSSTVIGVIEGEKHSGPFSKEYSDILKKQRVVDVKLALQDLLCTRESDEVQLAKSSSQYITRFMRKIVLDMECIIDEGKEITHSQFATNIENMVTNAAANIDLTLAFNPIIQSGGGYNLNLDFNDEKVKSNDNILKFDNIILICGVRYKSFCSMVARTYFVNASVEKEMDYEILYNVYQFLIKKKIKIGTTMDSIYVSAREFLRKKKPELVPHFTTKVGFCIGWQPSSPIMQMAEGNMSVVSNNMTFVVQLGFENVPEPGRSPYSMFIADTVVVSTEDYGM